MDIHAKEMIKLGYQFVTISSDFRSMSNHLQTVLNDMKNEDQSVSSTY